MAAGTDADVDRLQSVPHRLTERACGRAESRSRVRSGPEVSQAGDGWREAAGVGARVAPMSSMKGRVLSRGGWPFLTFVCGIGVVIIGIRSRRRGFGALPRIGCRVCWARLVGSSALPAGLGAWRRWWRLTRRVESGIGGFVLGSGGSGGWAPVSLTAFRLGRRLQSSIRSRGADQSVVRCSGGQSSGRPSCSVWRRRPDIGASSPERAPRTLVGASLV